MSFSRLEKFIELAKKSGVTELKYEGKDEKFYVSLGVTPTVHTLGNPIVTNNIADVSAPTTIQKKDPNVIEVLSPFVGTFYRASGPNAEPYIKLGQKIGAGQVLCIVEAMKIMNEIESEVSGEVVEICVENENYVEFGQVLFRIKP